MKIKELKEIAKKQGSYAQRNVYFIYGNIIEDCFIVNGDDKHRITVKQYKKLKELNLCECRLKHY